MSFARNATIERASLLEEPLAKCEKKQFTLGTFLIGVHLNIQKKGNKMMVNIIARLEFLRKYAKTIHYNYAGPDFLGIHTYMDAVAKPIDEFIDEIKEKYFMYNQMQVPSFETIDSLTIEMLKTASDSGYSVQKLAQECKAFVITLDEVINTMSSTLDNGDIDLLSRIESHFKTVAALLQNVHPM